MDQEVAKTGRPVRDLKPVGAIVELRMPDRIVGRRPESHAKDRVGDSDIGEVHRAGPIARQPVTIITGRGMSAIWQNFADGVIIAGSEDSGPVAGGATDQRTRQIDFAAIVSHSVVFVGFNDAAAFQLDRA